MSGSPKNSAFVSLAVAGLFFVPGQSFAQRISSFQLYPTSTSVVIRFTISAGPSCGGFTVFHSTDSVNYNEIGNDPAICSTTSAPEDKSFTHANPVFNQVNYYKVRLDPYVEISASRSIFVPQGAGTELLVYPNPVSATSGKIRLKVPGAENARLTGEIHDRFGKTLRHIELLTQGGIAELTIPGLEEGMYFVRVNNGATKQSCKFVVLR